MTPHARDIDRIANSLARIANNDLPHIQNRLNAMDLRMEKMEVNLAWSIRLMIILVTGGVALVLGVLVDALAKAA